MSIMDFAVTYKTIQFGDERGVGSVVQKKNLFGKLSTWTIKPYREAEDERDWFMDEWICRESGKAIYREFTPIDSFYSAQYSTNEINK